MKELTNEIKNVLIKDPDLIDFSHLIRQYKLSEDFIMEIANSDFEDKTEVEIKMIVLKHLDNVGAISSDVFQIESSELSADEFEEEDY
jgi:hypothetical protein